MRAEGVRAFPRGVRRIATGLIVILAAIVSTRADSEPNAPKNVADVAGLLQRHNRERVARKLPPLSLNAQLEAAALAHASDMARHNKMDHEGSDGSTPLQRIEREGYLHRGAGENIAYGAKSVADVMRVWMSSPSHKEHILGKYAELGAACVKADDGTPYWCVDFGMPPSFLEPAKAAAGVIAEINAAREKEGHPALKSNAKLAAAAERHARDMAAVERLATEDSDGLTPVRRVEKSGYRFRRLAETTASGMPTAEEAVKNWLGDKMNKEYILGDFREIGTGYGMSPKGVPYWCLILATPGR